MNDDERNNEKKKIREKSRMKRAASTTKHSLTHIFKEKTPIKHSSRLRLTTTCEYI